MTVCVKCGLSQDLCVCESIAKESQKIIVRIECKKFNKNYTVIAGMDQKEINLNQLAKKLKEKLACGGTVKGDKIELQGRHLQKVKEILVQTGFAPETIIIQQ